MRSTHEANKSVQNVWRETWKKEKFRDLGIDGWKVLIISEINRLWVLGVDSRGLGYSAMAGFCEHGTESWITARGDVLFVLSSVKALQEKYEQANWVTALGTQTVVLKLWHYNKRRCKRIHEFSVVKLSGNVLPAKYIYGFSLSKYFEINFHASFVPLFWTVAVVR